MPSEVTLSRLERVRRMSRSWCEEMLCPVLMWHGIDSRILTRACKAINFNMSKIGAATVYIVQAVISI